MAREAGEIVLKADSTGIDKGTKSLKRLEDQAAKTERGSKRLTSTYGAMSRIVGRLAAGISVGLFTRGVIRNTEAQEHAVAQLNATLQSTGRYTPEASKALQDFAKELQRVTTYGDETTIMAEAQLGTFKALGGEVFPRATEAVLDLATKMEGDLTGAVVLLGKALNDPATGLSYLTRVGITFSKAQIEVIKRLQETNQLAKAQGLILQEVESEFGGSARAARNTFGGAMKAAQNALGDLLEGDSGGEGVRGATQALNELTDTLNDPKVESGFQNLIGGTIRAVGWLAKLASGAANAATTIGEDLAAAMNGNEFDVQGRTNELAMAAVELTNLIEKQKEGKGHWWDPYVPTDADIEAARAKVDKLVNEVNFARELAAGKARRDKQGEGAAARVAATLPGVAPDAPGKSASEVARAQRDAARAAEDLRDILGDLAAAQRGPAVAAANQLAQTLRDLDDAEADLAANGELNAEKQKQLADAREGAIIQHQQTIQLLKEEAAAARGPAEQVISSLQFELELQKLGNVERQKRIALLNAETTATSKQGQTISAIIEQLAANDKIIGAMDRFRDAAVDALVSVGSQAQNAKEAFVDFLGTVRSLLLRMLAENLIEKVFGGFGGTGGGIFGFAASLFSGSGGGAAAATTTGGIGFGASGGDVFGGTPMVVGEKGPELIMPKTAGTIVPNQQLRSGGDVYVTIDARGSDDPGKILALVPLIQNQVERGIALKQRRGYWG